MSQASAYEQYMLELINAARAKEGDQPLAFNSNIETAAALHSDYQLDVDKLTHTGSGGTSAYTRMKNAGYDFNGSSTWGENVGWKSIGGVTGYQDDIASIHDWLMNSSGHRANILNGNFREIGIGIDNGTFLQGWNSVIATQDFAASKGQVFLTGVGFKDEDGDDRYDVGEGFGGFTVTAKNNSTGAVYTTKGGDAGGYALALPAGTYSYTFTASGYAPKTGTATIDTTNKKVDWIDPESGSTPSDPEPSGGGKTITGNSSANKLTGGDGDDTLNGLGGNDTLDGGGGSDKMIGGTGNDIFFVDDSNDLIVEYTKQGVDTVRSSVSYTLSDYVEELELTGAGDIGGTGSDQANTLTGNTGDNVLKGLDGDDRLYGDDGDDRLEGGSGDDFLQSGAGTDELLGGSGRDMFDWNYTSHIGKGSGSRDVILDFVQGSDKIDLSGIDADTDTSGNQAFIFVGTRAFSGVDGELRFQEYEASSGDYTVVQGDTNGDKIADFEIRLNGELPDLQATDFVL